mmetsp:Transcript_31075/g.37942  ORF Transcript_31075/g.37942 Transcript_31075/m.37942 type:complete len:87 (-) Transcript_31075:208-468(-)
MMIILRFFVKVVMIHTTNVVRTVAVKTTCASALMILQASNADPSHMMMMIGLMIINYINNMSLKTLVSMKIKFIESTTKLLHESSK